jgi:uncharacterized membrane protein YgcG
LFLLFGGLSVGGLFHYLVRRHDRKERFTKTPEQKAEESRLAALMYADLKKHAAKNPITPPRKSGVDNFTTGVLVGSALSSRSEESSSSSSDDSSSYSSSSNDSSWSGGGGDFGGGGSSDSW